MVILDRRARVFSFYLALCFLFKCSFFLIIILTLGLAIFEDDESNEENGEFLTVEEGFFLTDKDVPDYLLLLERRERRQNSL